MFAWISLPSCKNLTSLDGWTGILNFSVVFTDLPLLQYQSHVAVLPPHLAPAPISEMRSSSTETASLLLFHFFDQLVASKIQRLLGSLAKVE